MATKIVSIVNEDYVLLVVREALQKAGMEVVSVEAEYTHTDAVLVYRLGGGIMRYVASLTPLVITSNIDVAEVFKGERNIQIAVERASALAVRPEIQYV